MERNLRDIASVDANRGKGAHRPNPACQSSVECDIPGDRARAAAPAIPSDGGAFDIIFDLANHQLVIETSDCRVESFALKPMTVADFYTEIMRRLHSLGINVHIWTMPSEIENAIPFEQDRTHAQYDAVYAQRF